MNDVACWLCQRDYHNLCNRYMRLGQIESCGCDHHDESGG